MTCGSFTGCNAYPPGSTQINMAITFRDSPCPGGCRRCISTASKDGCALQQSALLRSFRGQASNAVDRTNQGRELAQIQAHISDDRTQPIFFTQVETDSRGTGPFEDLLASRPIDQVTINIQETDHFPVNLGLIFLEPQQFRKGILAGKFSSRNGGKYAPAKE